MVFLSPEADPAVRTFQAEILVENRDGSLMAGLLGNARLLRRSFENAVVIPLNAVIEGQTGRNAYVVENGLASRRDIELGGISGEYTRVISGINPGEALIVSGQFSVVDGERVNVTGEITIDGEGVASR
jgi:RND family efflux transporter MFP subunit